VEERKSEGERARFLMRTFRSTCQLQHHVTALFQARNNCKRFVFVQRNSRNKSGWVCSDRTSSLRDSAQEDREDVHSRVRSRDTPVPLVRPSGASRDRLPRSTRAHALDGIVSSLRLVARWTTIMSSVNPDDAVSVKKHRMQICEDYAVVDDT
jgi:hypothetical protein